jgi:tRNA threonylcarbamoyladenosine biosynthesis protein TsaB
MNTLIIDTSNNKEIKVGISIHGKEEYIVKSAEKWKSQLVLPVIDELLKKNKLDIKDISEISVNTGPGSFTGLRVGITIANALSFTCSISVNGNKAGEFVDGIYA